MADQGLLFIYGTLHPDQAPAEIADAVGKLRHVGTGTIRGHFQQLSDYPTVTMGAGPKTAVQGTVFELPGDPEVLRQLDAYEEFMPENLSSSLFVRKQTTVRLADGQKLRCWIYVYNRALAA